MALLGSFAEQGDGEEKTFKGFSRSKSEPPGRGVRSSELWLSRCKPVGAGSISEGEGGVGPLVVSVIATLRSGDGRCLEERGVLQVSNGGIGLR